MHRPNRRRSRIALLLSLTLTATMGTVAVTAAPAVAGCTSGTHHWSLEDGGIDSIFRAHPDTSNGVALRAGPHTSCALRGRYFTGTQVVLWCYDFGDVITGVDEWSYIAIRGTNVRGWMSDYYLAGGGARRSC